jgi:hypothetical protein
MQRNQAEGIEVLDDDERQTSTRLECGHTAFHSPGYAPEGGRWLCDVHGTVGTALVPPATRLA